MEKTFTEIAQHHFQFLINEFGFRRLSVQESPRGEQWEGVLRYTTAATYIEINCTRGEFPSLLIGRTKDEGRHLLPVQVIYEYMTLSDEEKDIVLRASEARQAASILRPKQLFSLITPSDSIEERKELQLVVFANVLQEYAVRLLQGDFSYWLATWEYHVGKLTAENKRSGRPEFVPIVITDSNGQLKVTGQQPVFRNALDYIQELRREQESST